MPNPFRVEGSWYKGNLHTHTTVSDGSLSPQETIQIYAEGDYDFLALTDHNAVVDYGGLDPLDMTLIPGCELAQGTGELGQSLHVVALGLDRVPEVPETPTFAELVGAAAAQCELCFAAHPFWSLVSPGELLGLRGHVGIEVYNATCQWGCGRGPTEHVWDVLLAHGQRLWGFAVDDAHRSEDYRRAWVMVKSVERSEQSIMAALTRGDFYASNGPVIRNMAIEGDELVVQCSACRQIGVIVAAPGAGYTTARLGLEPPFEQARLPLPSRGLPFRVEVIDEHGAKAWTNPVFEEETA
jgi:hypothetical protein